MKYFRENLRHRFPSHSRPGIFFALKLLFSVAIFSILLRSIDAQDVLERMRAIKVTSVLAVIGLTALQLAVSVYRWRVIIGFLTQKPPWLAVTRGILLERFVNQALPTPIGGDVARIYIVGRAGVGWNFALKSVVLDRGYALAGVVFTVALCLPWSATLISQSIVLWSLFGIAALTTCCLAILIFLPANVWIRTLNFLKLSRLGGTVLLARSMMRTPQTASQIFAASLSIQFIMLIAFFLLARSLDLPLTWQAALALVPPIFFLTQVPISIAGWGMREGASIFFLSFCSIAKADAFALSLMFGAIGMLVAVAGGIFWMFSGERLLRISGNPDTLASSEVSAGSPLAD